jgi:hypothetical protein
MNYVIGTFVICTAAMLFVYILLWVIRPLVFPRKGVWKGENYVICGKIEGDILTWNSLSFRAYAHPPLWAGMGNTEWYDNAEQARKSVERWCK